MPASLHIFLRSSILSFSVQLKPGTFMISDKFFAE